MISDGKKDGGEDEKFNDNNNNNSIKDDIIEKYNIEPSVNNYPMFVGEKNIQNSNRGFNRAVVEADESIVGTDVCSCCCHWMLMSWMLLFWMLAQAVLMIYLMHRVLWMLKQAV
jgi:hypothetical protein